MALIAAGLLALVCDFRAESFAARPLVVCGDAYVGGRGRAAYDFIESHLAGADSAAAWQTLADGAG